MTEYSEKEIHSDKSWKNPGFYCHDLPTTPRQNSGIVLVTGASGYIGGRLIPELVARGYRVRAMVRAASPEYNEIWPDVEVVATDALNKENLKKALEGVETAYYLMEDKDLLKLRIFIDHSSLEVFVDGKEFLATRIYPSLDESTGVSIRAQGKDAVLKTLDAWQMKNIWKNEKNN